MINNYCPNNFNSLIISKKQEFLNFYNKCKQDNNYNIAIVGNHCTCKTTIINIIINEFIKEKKIDKSKIVFYLNYFKDINLQDDNNDLHIFCKNNINCEKIVYIENFDYFNESNQQFLKIYIDTYNSFKKNNKIFFIIECSQKEKIKDIIKSRLNIYTLVNIEKNDLKEIFKNICLNEKITYDDNALEFILNIYNTTISYIKNFFIKIKLLKIKHINLIIVQKLYTIINFNIFKKYFNKIENNEIRQANNILIDLYNNGYDISDIYYYIYEYIKYTNTEKYFFINELICNYINEIYNGNHHKIMLIFLTFDIKKKLL